LSAYSPIIWNRSGSSSTNGVWSETRKNEKEMKNERGIAELV